ncbi:Gfo/Idh/MocA family oxidoreductase [Roseibacillus persicicus]|uniref:Gfo/Idh/MocA family protein n=1 Tax=Roseibacillus persicicus TaxID=454148 RepID=UPI00398BAC74
MSRSLKGCIVGAGYFARFQYQSWQSIPEVEIVANCNRTLEKAEAMAADYGIPSSYAGADFEEMLVREKPDFVDIITPPETHLEFCRIAFKHGVHMICQKPLAPTWDETLELLELVKAHPEVRFMVHENWRWQPWYREIKAILDSGVLGDFHHLNFLCRLGDGWGEDAYLARQPFFRDYKRLFIFETGVHFLDTFRFLFGEVSSLYASTSRRNPVIAGEDSALIVCHFREGGSAVLDANRYGEPDASIENTRYTFGRLRLDCSKGNLTLSEEGSIRIQLLGEEATVHPYSPSQEGFAGNCVHATQQHFVKQFLAEEPFESEAHDYLKSIELVELAYQSAANNQVQKLPS